MARRAHPTETLTGNVPQQGASKDLNEERAGKLTRGGRTVGNPPVRRAVLGELEAEADALFRPRGTEPVVRTTYESTA